MSIWVGASIGNRLLISCVGIAKEEFMHCQRGYRRIYMLPSHNYHRNVVSIAHVVMYIPFDSHK